MSVFLSDQAIQFSSSGEIKVNNFWDFKPYDTKNFIDLSNNLNVQDKYGWTLLMKLVSSSKRYDTETSIRTLIRRGADLNIRNNDGFTALMLAYKFANYDPRVQKIIDILLGSGAKK